MNRLQKKCFIGATGMHLLLVVILFVGPAFIRGDKVDDSPVLEIVPDITTDKDVKGGGPNQRQATQPPPSVAPPAQPPTPITQAPPVDPPPRIEPQKTEPPKVEKAEQAEPVKDPKPATDALEAKPAKPQPRKVQISDTVVRLPKDRKSPTTTTANKQADAQAAADRRKYADAAKAIKAGLSQTTTVEMPQGFGGGGPSYANYAQVVRKIYNDAWNAWNVPDDVTDDEATVQVRVTIARNGRVMKSDILRSSGSSAVVNAARAVLDRVTFVKEFPADSKDAERTFTMTFKLNAKKSIG